MIVLLCYGLEVIAQQNVAVNYKRKADSSFLKGNIKDAEKWYHQVVEIRRQQKKFAEFAFALTDLAALELTKGNTLKAVQLGRSALSLLPKFQNDTIEFRIVSYLSIFYDGLYKRDSADYFADKADALIEKSKLVQTRDEALYHFLDRGLRALHENDFKLADTYFQKTLSISSRVSTFDVGVLYNNMALSLFYQKKYDASLKYYQLALSSRINSNAERIWLNLAECYLALQNFQAAFKIINVSWKKYKLNQVGGKVSANQLFEQRYWRALGIYYKAISQLPKALHCFHLSLNISKKNNPKGIETADILGQMAQLYTIQNQPKKALAFYQKSLEAGHRHSISDDYYQNPDLNNILIEREFFLSLLGKASAFSQLHNQTHQEKDLKAALDTYQLAIQLADKMRLSYQSPEAKLFFTENSYSVYEHAIQVAHEMYKRTHKPLYQNLIYDFYEKSRAATLSDITREADIKPKTIPAKLLAKEKRLFQQIASLKVIIQQIDSLNTKKYKAQLLDKELELELLTERFEREFPAYFQLKYATQSFNKNYIRQKLLSNDAALVEYFLTPTQLYILVLTREHSQVIVQGVDSSFRKSVLQFRTLLSQNPGSKMYEGEQSSANLYTNLITPIIPLISSKKRLVIVRDTELNYLPFEVLAAKPDDYLLKKYAISYAYSVSLLLDTLKTKSYPSRLSIAPFTGSAPNNGAFRDNPLVPLPASEREVKQIGGDVYLAKDATKKHFLEQYRNHGIIHFATHALTNDNDPMRSFIAFYPDSNEYRLFTNELYDLNLNHTQLVVLSACETGAGKLHRGEGVMSLARAFAYAGTRSVVTTLWNANDDVTAYISTKLHVYLNQGLTIDQALQRAKLDFLSSHLARRYDHPYYWANLILIGRTNPIESSVTNHFQWFVVLCILIGLASGYYLWRKQKN